MTPAQAIAALDRQLASHGRAVTLSRVGGVPANFTCRAFVRNFKPDEIIGAIQQGDRLIILSPTDLNPAGWAAPQQGDRVRIDGVWSRVQAPDRIAIGETIVRVELQVRGG